MLFPNICVQMWGLSIRVVEVIGFVTPFFVRNICIMAESFQSFLCRVVEMAVISTGAVVGSGWRFRFAIAWFSVPIGRWEGEVCPIVC